MPRVMPKPYYRCGEYTLYCADARNVLPMLLDGSIDFVFTDPPYGHNNNNGDLIHNREAALGKGKSGAARAIANDGQEDASELAKFLFAESNRLLKPGCCCCCCCGGGGGPDPQFARWSLWLDEAIGFKHMVIWDKGPIGMGWHYRRSYETVLVGEKPGAACKWYDETDAVENILRYPFIKKIIPAAYQHPTAKPIELAQHFIRLHSQIGDTVLDPFAGAGSTVLAAVKNGRKCVAIEIDEHWCAETVIRVNGWLNSPKRKQ